MFILMSIEFTFVKIILNYLLKKDHLKLSFEKNYFCCKSKELERDKEETKREFRGNSDDFYFMLIRPIYRLIVRRPKAFT